MIRFVDDVTLYTDLQVDIPFALLYYLDMTMPNRTLSRSSTTFHWDDTLFVAIYIGDGSGKTC